MDFHCIAGDSEEENFRAVPALSRSKVLDIAAGAEHSAVITGMILQIAKLLVNTIFSRPPYIVLLIGQVLLIVQRMEL